MSDEKNLTAMSGGISFDTQKFAFGQRIGLKNVSSDTSVLEKVIDALTTVEGDLTSVLDTLFGGKTAAGGPTYGYDPSAKWLAGLAITYGVLTLDILLVDGQFYGLLIKIGKPPKPKPPTDNETNGNGESDSDRLAQVSADDGGGDKGDDNGPFAGLKLEIIYRKINDHLGEFSADLTLPDKFRKFKLGTASLTLPVVGIAIWTNGDFKVSIGWPLGDRSFNIAFPPSPIPWAGGGGLYFAKLRSEDSPGKLGANFNPIIEFGIGLRIGAATKGDAGILSYGASIYLFGTFQGFLAWEEGHSFSDGLDYYWFCASVGITGHLEGSVDFVVIKVTVSLDITASVTLALETAHRTYAEARFTAEVTAKIKILFFTIHFSFKLDVSVGVSFGPQNEPVALISGPTPPSSTALRADAEPVALAGEVAYQEAVVVQSQVTLDVAPTPIPISLSFLLQPTIRYDVASKNWLPVGIASLVIARTAPTTTNEANLGLGNDNFSQMIQSLASYILQTFGGYTDPTAPVTSTNLSALETALEGSQFNLASINNWLNTSNIAFTITGATADTGSADGALFPVIPGLVLTYNSQSTTFGANPAPTDYLTVLENYFEKLSLIGDGSINEEALNALFAAPVNAETWMPGVIFTDYFNILAKQICKELEDLKAPGTLAADLAQIDVGNLAGIVTRFLQHGLRLPDPSDTVNLLPLFDLTGQQFDVVNDNTNNPILSAVISGTAQVNVTISGGGSALLPFALNQPPSENSPICTPQPLERIKYVPLSYLLRQGLPWAQQVNNAAQQWMMFGFPDTLQSQLRLQNQLSLQLNSTDGSQTNGQTNLTPINGTGGLMIRFSLTPIPQPGGKTPFLPTVFKVTGTDETTRDLMEILFASGDLANSALDLMLPVGATNSGSGFQSSTADAASTLLLKTNLSTDNQPNAMAFFAALNLTADDSNLPALGPTWAAITNPNDFLVLLWECSVVHSGGFYLFVPDMPMPSSAQPIDVAVMVKSSASPTPKVSVNNYQNTILVDATKLTASDRVQADVYQTDGVTPVTEPKPNYPAGTLAFGATWNNPPADATADNNSGYATTLYQMLEFQLAGGNGIEDSGWSMPLGPNGDATVWNYERAVPVYRFVQGAAATPNRYGAIGIETTVNLQLVDVFGNAYGLNPLPMMAVYNDPLISIDEYPGAYIVYSFTAGNGGTATLELQASFDPTQVTETVTALAYYQIIYDQLTDPRVSLSVTTALAADAVTVTTSTGDKLQTALTEFVGAIIAFLTPNSTSAAPADVTLTGTVTTNYVSQIGEDLFPLWVSLTISRSAPQENETYNYPDGFLSIVSQLPPLLTVGASDPAALRTWSMGFESAFNNYDGSQGLLKVLAGTPPAKVTATRSLLGKTAASAVTSTPGNLWAIKWSAANGVSVSFGNASKQQQQQPVYFAPLPLATELISGNVNIDSFDANGNPLPPTPAQTFSGVDLDGMGSSFLQAMDSLLSPELATAIAQVDGTKYNLLMTYKEQLAYAISSSISWVLEAQMQGNIGDKTSAQKRFRENLLASLGSDFATSVIVQVPATVTVKNQFETDNASSRPPDFFGNPTPTSDSVSTATLNQYTISTSALPATDGAGYLNFLVEAIDPTIKSDLLLDFAYDINFIDHQFETSEEQYGYVPSSWLRFIVPDQDPTGSSPVLDVSMGELDIPIPLRAYPLPPRLVHQGITSNSAPATIGDALQFSYDLTLARPVVAQDDLHLRIEFNGAQPTALNAAAAPDPLFAALANFQAFQAQYLPTATDAIIKNSASAEQWLTDITNLVKAVADAWSSESESLSAASEFDAPPPVPAPFTWDFMLRVPDEFNNPNVLYLSTDESDANVWCLIEGVAGEDDTPITPYKYTKKYTLPNTANLYEPTMSWQNLAIITNQSISAEAWIERNETLKSGEATNPAFVYTTATVTFPSPVIPLVEASNKITLTSTSVSDAVNQLVTQIMQPTTPPTQVGWSLQANYNFVLVAGNSGQQLTTVLPVFLVKTAVSTAATLPLPPPTVETAQDLITALEGALASWYGDFHPSDTNASLLFAVTLFAANSQQPLARLLDIETPISGPGWWNPPTVNQTDSD
jgi:hypothetical protein